MPEDNKDLKQDQPDPTDKGNGVKNEDPAAPKDQNTDIDYEKEFNELVPKFVKSEEDKENYRKAMLKNKGKLPDEDPEEEEERIRRIVREENERSESTQATKQVLDLIPKVIKENKELKVALQNKSQISTTGPGAASDTAPAKKDEGLVTADQVAFFKSQGWSDAKIDAYKKNYQKRLASR